MKKVLILSQGPVPVPEHPTVEGGGLRCWGLAKGLVANNKGVEVTVAYEESYKKHPATTEHEGINITTWSLPAIASVISGYDAIIVSYCMGDLSVRVAEEVNPSQQLILDCYVPIYVEVSARESKRVDEEFRAFETDVRKWDNVLRRGDLFLCANLAQKDFYRGVLAAVGRINPVTYSDDLILIVPYGIYRDEPKQTSHPIDSLVKDNKYRKVLWFGGIYPWFDLRHLADAIKEVNKIIPAKLIIVGAKNPFNNHPDFLARYNELVEYISTEKLQEYVIIQDWIDFNDRQNWYLDADLVVVFNKEGEENKLAWRTRLVDFMWADLPVLTNGGDPLGETLIANDAAIRLPADNFQVMADSIANVLRDNKKITDLKKNLNKLKRDYYWDTVTSRLAQEISSGTRAKDLEKMDNLPIPTQEAGALRRIRVRQVLSRARKVPAYARKYGYKTTGLVIAEMVRRKLSSSIKSRRKENAVVFISHQLDLSGAPFIAVDMALEFKQAGKNVEFYTYLPVHKDNLSKLSKHGVKPHLLMKKEMVPAFIPGDTIVMNTVAHSETVKETIFNAVEKGDITLLWYVHEDHPEILFRPDERKRIKKMLQSGRVKILIAAHKMRQNYVQYFESEKNIEILKYRHIVPKKFHRQLSAEAFNDKLTFVLPGTVGDGRKGQLPIFYAFSQFYEQFYKRNPNGYRDFELVFIGLSKDYLSQQLIAHADALKGHFRHYDKVTWLEDLEIVHNGNITICYSLGECLPLFVFEGMIAGHPILRNDSSGMEEQLNPGKNGFYLDTNNFTQVVDTIERVLNKERTSNERLARMSKESYKIAKMQEENSYLTCLDEDGK